MKRRIILMMIITNNHLWKNWIEQGTKNTILIIKYNCKWIFIAVVEKCMWNGKKKEMCRICQKKQKINNSWQQWSPKYEQKYFFGMITSFRIIPPTFFLFLLCQRLFGLSKYRYVSHSKYVVYFITWSKLIWSLFFVVSYIYLCCRKCTNIIVIILLNKRIKFVYCFYIYGDDDTLLVNYNLFMVFALSLNGMRWIYFFFFLLLFATFLHVKNVWQL